MEYQVTAIRRRPQSLEQLSGQVFVQQTLHNAITSGHIAHAYLFSGPRGVGKTSAARILARSVNCERGPTSQPCGRCSSCLDILGGKAIDVIEIDGASHTGVDDIREIKDEVLYAPGSARYKVFIIDEVHMLSNSAFNALLKTIEEPPEYIIFIFATTEIHKVPLTVRSRCQHYHFHLVSLEQIQQNLAAACEETGRKYRNEALLWIAREAKGSMRDAYTLFDQVASFCGEEALTLELIQQKMGLIAAEQMSQLLDALIERNMKAAIGLYQSALQSGSSLEQMLVDLCEYFRALLLLQSGLSERQLLLLLPYPSAYYSKMAQQSWNREQLCHILERSFALYRNLRYSINEHFELELLLFEIAELKNYHSGAYQLNRLEELVGQLQNGLPAAFFSQNNGQCHAGDAALIASRESAEYAGEAKKVQDKERNKAEQAAAEIDETEAFAKKKTTVPVACWSRQKSPNIHRMLKTFLPVPRILLLLRLSIAGCGRI